MAAITRDAKVVSVRPTRERDEIKVQSIAVVFSQLRERREDELVLSGNCISVFVCTFPRKTGLERFSTRNDTKFRSRFFRVGSSLLFFRSSYRKAKNLTQPPGGGYKKNQSVTVAGGSVNC